MPSHRSTPPNARGSLLRRRLRSVLLYGEEQSPGRSPVAGPLALLGVGGVFAVAVVTGQPHAAQAALRPAGTVAAPAPDSEAVLAASAASLPGASRVLHDLMVRTPRSAASHASRSERRQPLLHRWVRPDSGPLTSPYGYRWGTLHPGDDLAGPYGSPI